MKGFYALISSVSGPQNPYLEALAQISRINLKQTKVLMSDLGWQEWVGQNQKIAAA